MNGAGSLEMVEMALADLLVQPYSSGKLLEALRWWAVVLADCVGWSCTEEEDPHLTKGGCYREILQNRYSFYRVANGNTQEVHEYT